MAKKTKKTLPDSFLDKPEERECYDLDAVLVEASVCYFIREELREQSKKYHRGLGPVSKQAMLAAVRELGLENYLSDDVM